MLAQEDLQSVVTHLGEGVLDKVLALRLLLCEDVVGLDREGLAVLVDADDEGLVRDLGADALVEQTVALLGCFFA